MITRKQYLDALEIIDCYHRKLDIINAKQENDFNKTKIIDWCEKNKSELGGRVFNLLTDNYDYDNGKPFEYLEDVNRREFLRLRNSGEKSWNIFLKVKNKSI